MNDRVRVRGVTVYRPIIYGNTSVPLTEEERKNSKHPDHTFRWTVAVRSPTTPPNSKPEVVGGADDLGYFIKRVTFKLHETYQPANRNVDKPPFEVTETGWGEFEIGIRITFVQESGEKAISLHHHLKLHPWGPNDRHTDPSGPPPPPSPYPVHSWQYDEIVFHEPFQSFYNILTSNPPTLLPSIRKKPVPPIEYPPPPGAPTFSAQETPEFTSSMEKEEADRLEAVRKMLLTETDKMRMRLFEKEEELKQLKNQTEA